MALKLTSCSAIWTALSALSPDSRLGGGVWIPLISLCSASFRRRVMFWSSDRYERDTDSSFSTRERERRKVISGVNRITWVYWSGGRLSHRSPCWAAGPGSAAEPPERPAPAHVSRSAWTENFLCCRRGSRRAGTPDDPWPAAAPLGTDYEPGEGHERECVSVAEQERTARELKKGCREEKESYRVQVPSSNSADVFEQVVPGNDALHVYVQLMPQRHDFLVQLLCPERSKHKRKWV